MNCGRVEGPLSGGVLGHLPARRSHRPRAPHQTVFQVLAEQCVPPAPASCSAGNATKEVSGSVQLDHHGDVSVPKGGKKALSMVFRALNHIQRFNSIDMPDDLTDS